MPRLIDANELKKQKTILWDEALGFCDCVVVEDIDKAPTVEVVHGQWLNEMHGNTLNGTCSVCGSYEHAYAFEWKYCPFCGAKMYGDVNG